MNLFFKNLSRFNGKEDSLFAQILIQQSCQVSSQVALSQSSCSMHQASLSVKTLDQWWFTQFPCLPFSYSIRHRVPASGAQVSAPLICLWVYSPYIYHYFISIMFLNEMTGHWSRPLCFSAQQSPLWPIPATCLCCCCQHREQLT